MHRYDSVLPRDAEKRVYFKSFKLTSHMLSSQIAHAIKSNRTCYQVKIMDFL